jgi:hypothetical protein
LRLANSGNVAFRDLVLAKKLDYRQAQRVRAKDDIARRIIDEIANRNGKFLRKIESPAEVKKLGLPEDRVARAWTMAKDDVVLEKVKQALREKHVKKERHGGSVEKECLDRVHRRKRMKVLTPCTAQEGLMLSTSLESELSRRLDRNRQLLSLCEQQQILRVQQLAGVTPWMSQHLNVAGRFQNALLAENRGIDLAIGNRQGNILVTPADAALVLALIRRHEIEWQFFHHVP